MICSPSEKQVIFGQPPHKLEKMGRMGLGNSDGAQLLDRKGWFYGQLAENLSQKPFKAKGFLANSLLRKILVGLSYFSENFVYPCLGVAG
jgi:hypothetical protein